MNPRAGARDSLPRAQRLAELLQRQDFKVEIFTDLQAVASAANEMLTEGSLRTLVAVGGDGTAAELVNRTLPGVPLTLFPAGNSNLAARYFALSNDPDVACRTILEGTAAKVDAGLANSRIFLLMVGCGFDADVVHRVHGRRKGHMNQLAYLKPIAEAAFSYHYPEIQIHLEGDEQPLALSARWLFLFNLPCYGGGFRIAPHADGSDGMLDLCTLRGGRMWHGLWYTAMILLRRHHTIADWATRRVTRLKLTSNDEVPYQLDGDPGGKLPLEVDVLPSRLTLIVPKATITPR